MGPFPDKKLTRGVLKMSTPAVADNVRNHSLVFSLALGLIFGLPDYLFSCDIINFFSTDHAVAGVDLPGPGIVRDEFLRGGCLFFIYCNFSARIPKNLQVLREVPHTA